MFENEIQLAKLKILLLDCSYQPLRFISWKESIELIWSELTDVIENTFNTEEFFARSPSIKIQIPSVLRLRNSIKIPRSRLAPYSSLNVFTRDNWQCQLNITPKLEEGFSGCQAPNPGDLKYTDKTLDHVVSKYYGGESSFLNVVAACYACNQYKRHHLSIRPKRAPYHPTWLSVHIKKYLKISEIKEWKEWLKL